MDINSTQRFLNDYEMPVLGIGTWDMYKETLESAVLHALSVGYRSIDTASYYNNETEVGNAIRKSNISREDIFLTTKVYPSEFNDVHAAFHRSYNRLSVDYIDLYLIHWPSDEKSTDNAWKELLGLVQTEKLRSIGVSSFSADQIEHLKSLSDIIPVNNQVEFHPSNFDDELLDYCKGEGITVTAFSPLNEGKQLNHPKFVEIASHYNKTTAQLLLRWGLQKGVNEIPKSANFGRIEENANIFDFKIDSSDMESLDNLS